MCLTKRDQPSSKILAYLFQCSLPPLLSVSSLISFPFPSLFSDFPPFTPLLLPSHPSLLSFFLLSFFLLLSTSLSFSFQTCFEACKASPKYETWPSSSGQCVGHGRRTEACHVSHQQGMLTLDILLPSSICVYVCACVCMCGRGSLMDRARPCCNRTINCQHDIVIVGRSLFNLPQSSSTALTQRPWGVGRTRSHALFNLRMQCSVKLSDSVHCSPVFRHRISGKLGCYKHLLV